MSAEIQTRADQGIGTITLDRPKALNALNLSMIRALREILEIWQADPAIQAVVIGSAGKAFCAGGDIRAVREASLAGEHHLNEAFFAEEYALNQLISDYPKPYLSLIDGVCMGGGMGLSIHGRYRVITERGMLAMPETAIGFFPDIGSSWFLPRLPRQIGLYLGLTGARLHAADALYCGLATHYVPSSELPALRQALLDNPQNLAAILERRQQDPGPAPLKAVAATIERTFARAEPKAILQALEDLDSDWGRDTLKTLHRLSPNSLQMTCQLYEAGAASPDLHGCLEREYQLGREATRHPDFIEGVRAVLVDKDHHPHWQSSLD